MAITSAEELAQQALSHNLLDERQLQEVWGQFGSRSVSLEEFRQVLLRRDLLTFYQIEHLMMGDRSTFYYGNNKVLYLVGTGTFARVYRAVNTVTGDIVAVKVLRKRYSETREEAQRFYREGQMGMILRHPNIVPIYEVESKGLVHYIVIEFIEGRNLHEFIRIRKVFEPLEATRLMLDIASGLDFAFQKGITHRDLKMSNVLISSRGQAKLVDFGLAALEKNVSDDVLLKNANPRAIDYAGLERATGVRRDDPRSDIFFAGCIYYHMLTGTPPLAETRDRTLRLSRQRFQDIPPITNLNPGLPPGIVVVVNRALQFDVERRYQTPSEMVADLREVLDREGQTVAVEPGAARASPAETESAGEGLRSDGTPRTVMLVDSDMKMQDILRARLKRNGYRVLVTGNPEGAVHRLAQERDTADVVLFSTGLLSEAALEAFNALGQQTGTEALPAILMLDERHKSWKDQARLAPHRQVLEMPISLRKLRETLVRVCDVAEPVGD